MKMSPRIEEVDGETIAHRESIDPSESADFNWDDLDPDTAEEMRREIRGKVLQCFLRLAHYLTESGKGTVVAAGMRAFILGHQLIPELRKLKQSELADITGHKHKQSIGRFVSEFRDTFPLLNHHDELTPIKTEHMRRESARLNARKREAKRRDSIRRQHATERKEQSRIRARIRRRGLAIAADRKRLRNRCRELEAALLQAGRA